MIFLPSLLTSQFLSTPSARRATPGLRDCPVQVGDFYPRPPRGGRRLLLHGGCPLCNFYPRPPRGGRQHNGLASGTVQQFLSTPSARRATFFSFSVSPSNRLFLSTPSARRATARLYHGSRSGTFLSTPSARRATVGALEGVYGRKHFYPRPPRGGRQGPFQGTLTRCKFLSTPSARRATQAEKAKIGPSFISIHALREEGDPQECSSDSCLLTFLSTPSARRATCSCDKRASVYHISIHALREEGDSESRSS